MRSTMRKLMREFSTKALCVVAVCASRARVIMGLMTVLSFLLFQPVVASTVDVEQAKVAVSNWVSRIKGSDFSLNNDIANSFTLSVCDGEGHVHVINLSGGGFVITSADDELMPILAFSQTGSIMPSDSGDGGGEGSC